MTEIAKYNGMMSYLTRPPAPKTQVADLVDDLEPGALKDMVKKEKDEIESLKDVDIRDTIIPTGNLVSKQLKVMRLSEDIQPGLFENLTDKQIEIIDKYGDLVDRELLKNIVLDPDPNNQAAAIATLDEVKTLMDKGMSTDEIMNVLQSTPRRKQAEGGLSYLMGM